MSVQIQYLIDPASLINHINQVNHWRKGGSFSISPTPHTHDHGRVAWQLPELPYHYCSANSETFAPSVRASMVSIGGMPASQASSQVRLYPLCTTQRRHSRPAPEGSNSPAMSPPFVGCAAYDRSRSCSCNCMYYTLPPIKRCCFTIHSYD